MKKELRIIPGIDDDIPIYEVWYGTDCVFITWKENEAIDFVENNQDLYPNENEYEN